MLRLLTAGESHGPIQVAVVDGMPAGLPLEAAVIDAFLARRQFGHGRGGRMKIEKDRARILSGVRNGFTTGGPVTFLTDNADFKNWVLAMSPEPVDPADEARLAAVAAKAIGRLRPGHADFAGAVKYGLADVRDVLERSSARETVARVAAGALAAHLLRQIGVDLASHVVAIGGIAAAPADGDLADLRARAEGSPVRCADAEASAAMVALIDATGKGGDSLGGVVEVIATGLPVGLGSYAQWDRRLDGRLAQAVMSIPAIKGVEIGLGFELARRTGSQAHDTFQPGFSRPTNMAGGLEGGVTNGQPLILRAAMKPISTLRRPLPSATWPDGAETTAHFERADVCAVPAAGVIAEAMVAWVLADALLEKVGGDSLAEFQAHMAATRAAQPAIGRREAHGVAAGAGETEDMAE
ncbi:MAG: chorismate synthase [Candidatus Sericytochromatia bacterium]|nr:chorismate synthase [Candidatus Tanganyikabacteria bacterium]